MFPLRIQALFKRTDHMEIHYCSECRTRVSSLDLEQGKGAVHDGSIFCEKCARKLGLDTWPQGGANQKKPGAPKPGAPRRKGSGTRKTGSGVRRAPGGTRRSSSAVRKAHTGGTASDHHRPRSISKKTDVYTLFIVLLSVVVMALLIIIVLILTGRIQLSKEGEGEKNRPVSEQTEDQQDTSDKQKPAEDTETPDTNGEKDTK